MRSRSPLTAPQLKSVAYRYRNDLSAGGVRGMPVRCLNLRVGGAGRAPEAPGPDGRDHRLQRLEAVLFLAREPLTSRKLSQYANLADGTEARTLVRRLNDLYDKCGRAFRVERIAGGYQMLTRPHFATWIRRLEHVPRETRLSAPAMETLAVVAYRQPVLRADIEAIRGVSCGEILRQLMERDLVRIGGRSEELGRPYLYTTTRSFLCAFGLEGLDSLPRVEAMRAEEGQSEAAMPLGPRDLHKSTSIDQDEGQIDQQQQEGSNMPIVIPPGLGEDQSEQRTIDDDLVIPQLASTFDDDDDDDDDFFNDDEDEDYDDFDDDDDEDDDFADGEWQEVDDEDDDWDDDDSDWGDEDDEDEDDDDW
jgi:segregation and condensation protein B